MKLLPVSKPTRALTLIELLTLITIGGVLLVVTLPIFSANRAKARRIGCVNNLKMIGLSFRLWDGEQGRFPMEVSTNEIEYVGSKEVANETWRNFLTMSNELPSPKFLVCPSDDRKVAKTWTELSNKNVSYFVGMDSSQLLVKSFLSGDRNLTNGQPLQNQVMTITSNTPVGWTAKIHVAQGNIGMGDGSVQQTTNQSLQTCVNAALEGFAQKTVRLAIP